MVDSRIEQDVNNPPEVWRWVVGYEGLYMVSNYGAVMAAPHNNKDGKMLKPAKSNNGYLRVSLWKDGSYRKPGIHRLVALAFVPNPHGKCQVNHIDGNRENNHSDNLEWVTARENIRHKYDVLKYRQPSMPSRQRRFTDDQVRAIRLDKRKPSVICLDYGVSRQCIADIKKRKYYREVV